MDILTYMRTYVAVVTAGSFTGAAERLGISKALTSKYVGQLEEHLGVRLLNRTTCRLNVTEVGQAYYQRCRQLLDDMDELEAAVREQQDAPRGRLKVAAPTSFGEMYLTRAVADYLKERQNVTVELVLADRLVNLVEEGFDLAVRIGKLADSSLIARRLAPMRVVVCASPEHLKNSPALICSMVIATKRSVSIAMAIASGGPSSEATKPGQIRPRMVNIWSAL